MKIIRECTAFLLALLLFFGISWTAGQALMPARTVYGSMWESFLLEEEDSLDALFFGSSISYCDVIPAVIHEASGLSSYVMAGPEQTIPMTYYYMREVCETQSPDLMVLEMTGMFFQEYENYTKVNIGYMPMGENRLHATFEAAEKEEQWGLLFPLQNYHYRWQEILDPATAETPPVTADICAGYTLLTESCGVPEVQTRDYSAETAAYAKNLDYLGRIKAFCDAQDIQLLCYLAPWAMEIPQDAYDTLLADAESLGIEIADLNLYLDQMEIDDETDWFDFLHFNLYGGEKFSRFLAGFIEENYDIDHRPVDAALWADRAAHIHQALENRP